MSTKKNQELTLRLRKKIVKLLTTLTYHEQKSVSGLCFSKEPILETLDRQEDVILSSLADTRDVKNTKKTNHSDTWK